MRTNQINRLIKTHLLPHLHSYQVAKGVMYRTDVPFFIKGYDFEVADDDEYGLAVWCFVQPLFRKSETLYYTFGHRLNYKKKIGMLRTRELEWWDARKENLDDSFQSILNSIIDSGEKFLNSIGSTNDFYQKYKSGIKKNIRVYEAVAYSSILIGDKPLQDKMLKGLVEFTLRKDHRGTEWVDDIRQDAILLSGMISTEDRMDTLIRWAEITLRHIGLPGSTDSLRQTWHT